MRRVALNAGIESGFALYVLLALAALLAHRFPVFALAQAPAPQLAVIGLLLTVIQATRRRFVRASVALACATVFGIMVAPFLSVWPATETDQSSAADPVKLKIVLVGNSGRAMVDYILASRPDIVAVADRSAPGHEQVSRLAEAYPASLAAAGAGGPIVLARTGVNLTRLPAADALSGIDHIAARISIDGAQMDIVVLHLERPFPLTAESEDSVPALAEGLRGLDLEHLLLIGDFNRTPWMSSMSRLRSSLQLTTADAVATWPAQAWPMLRLPIDQVLAGAKLRVVNIGAGPAIGSDHLPVIAEIGIVPR